MKLSSILIPIISIFFLQSNLFSQSGWFQQVSGTNVNLHSVNSHHGNENIAWSCGDNGVILHTTNGGTSWVQQVSGTTNDLYCICFMETAGGPVMAVGESGIILRTTNFGTNWITIPSPTTRTLRDISDYNFVAVGDSGVILKSSNEGLNWVTLPSPTTQQLNATSAIFANYIVGNNGTVLRGFSSDTNWVLTSSGTGENLYGVPLFGNTDITIGTGGIIWRSTNFGTTWFGQNSNTSVTLRSVEYSVNNASRIYICGDNGTIIKSTNSGAVFGFQTTSTTQNLNSIFFYLSDNRGYACGNNGTILKTNDGGGTIITSINNSGELPLKYSLKQNYPNPFNPVTSIRFSLAIGELTKISVYDITGKETMVLINRFLNAGEYEVTFDGSNFSSGVYYYILKSGEFTQTRKMIMVK
ncbi:MAG: T9SS type A sorting domain-containing protein [Ignavibacteria bacterium]|nr:T9SS type A sorting domain-containing protein [Ignavibacteria bacterium]